MTVPKGQRRLAGLDQAIISLYAKGLTTGDIESHLEDVIVGCPRFRCQGTVGRTVDLSWPLHCCLITQTTAADPQILASIAHTAVAAIEGGFILSRTARDSAVLRSIGEQIASLYSHVTEPTSRSE